MLQPLKRASRGWWLGGRRHTVASPSLWKASARWLEASVRPLIAFDTMANLHLHIQFSDPLAQSVALACRSVMDRCVEPGQSSIRTPTSRGPQQMMQDLCAAAIRSTCGTICTGASQPRLVGQLPWFRSWAHWADKIKSLRLDGCGEASPHGCVYFISCDCDGELPEQFRQRQQGQSEHIKPCSRLLSFNG